jgi:hypothetical protein
MLSPSEEVYLAHCRRLIEQKLRWGHPDQWSTQDFEQLAEEIARQTGVTLSLTTLKRIWGRVRYQSAPTATTLNALATFIGYASWREFQASVESIPAESAPAPVQSPRPQTLPEATAGQSAVPQSGNRQWLIGIGLTVALLSGLLWFRHQASRHPTSPAAFSFSSQPVTRGIPNSVVFRYDASRASAADSVFIQQSWDPARRQRVPNNGNAHTSVYYYPGYYRAKLVVNQQVVREHDVIIPSEGWVTTIPQEPVPVYFSPAEVIRGGALHLPASLIRQRNISLQPSPPMVGYQYVGTGTGLMSDNFVYQTRVRASVEQGAGVCQNVRILINCRNDMFLLHLSAKGCVGQLGLMLADQSIMSQTSDLSAFGRDLNEWVQVRCEVREKRVRLFIDEQLAYETTFTNDPAEILGISYWFEGTGSVDFVRLSRLDGETVLADDFDAPEAGLP